MKKKIWLKDNTLNIYEPIDSILRRASLMIIVVSYHKNKFSIGNYILTDDGDRRF